MPQTGKNKNRPVEPSQQGTGLKMSAHPLLLDTSTPAPQSKKDRYKPMQPKFASIKVRLPMLIYSFLAHNHIFICRPTSAQPLPHHPSQPPRPCPNRLIPTLPLPPLHLPPRQTSRAHRASGALRADSDSTRGASTCSWETRCGRRRNSKRSSSGSRRVPGRQGWMGSLRGWRRIFGWVVLSFCLPLGYFIDA